MRPAFLPVALLAACAMSGGPGTAASAVTLTCPATENPLVMRMCSALKDALHQSGHQLDDAAPVHLILSAESPRSDLLKARLTVEDANGRHDSDEIELSVMDRTTIPQARIDDFARLLLDQAALPGPRR